MTKTSTLAAWRKARDKSKLARAKAAKIRAEASKIKNEGKAARDSILTEEKYKTKRTAARAAAFASAVESKASVEREKNSQTTRLWNSIINGTNSSITDNENTSNNTTESTTSTQEGGR